MTASMDLPPNAPASFDSVTEDLQLLRQRAGNVSYAEIATRVARLREERGVSAAAARVARSTVFDAFRTGRRRINADLVADIALALGEDAESAEHWRSRCLQIEPMPQNQAVVLPVVPPAHTLPGTPSMTGHPEALRTSLMFMLLIACVGVNIFGNTVVMKYGMLIFLDMVGTAIAAIILGPWYGVAVAVSTNLLTSIAGESVSIWFGLVNVTGALVWGYGYHRFRMGRTHLRFFFLNICAAVACTLVAAPITVLLFQGNVLHASNTISQSLLAFGQGVWIAVISANILASILDKLISGYVPVLAKKVLEPFHLGCR